MALDKLQKRMVKNILEKFCSERIPMALQNQIKLEFNIRGNYVTLFEKKIYFKGPSQWTKGKIAQFRYDPDNNKWTLYWWRHTGKWYKYEEIKPQNDLQKLVDEVDKDPTAIFWG
jgi:hypothetical protein